MRQRCDETQLTLMSPDTQGTLYVWAAGAGPRSTFGTLGNLIPRALKAHAEVPVSKVEIELTDCRLSYDQIERLAADGRFSRS
jgi:hypothetical protein